MIYCYQPRESTVGMKLSWKSLGVALTSASLFMGAQAIAGGTAEVFDLTIKEDQVVAAGKSWCAALVDISNTFHNEGAAAAKAKAEAIIDAA